jgi:hypothetical protein
MSIYRAELATDWQQYTSAATATAGTVLSSSVNAAAITAAATAAAAAVAAAAVLLCLLECKNATAPHLLPLLRLLPLCTVE